MSALRAAVDVVARSGASIDGEIYFPKDLRFCLIRWGDAAWQGMIATIRRIWSVVSSLFVSSSKPTPLPLFSHRFAEDKTGGLNALLHLEKLPEECYHQMETTLFACHHIYGLYAVLQRVFEEEFPQSFGEVAADERMKEDLSKPALQSSVIAHLHALKELELFLGNAQKAREQGRAFTPELAVWMRTFVGGHTTHVDPVTLFHQILRSLPGYPAWAGFLMEEARMKKTGEEYVPPEEGGHREGLPSLLATPRPADDRLPSPHPRRSESLLPYRLGKPCGMVEVPYVAKRGEAFLTLLQRFFAQVSPFDCWMEDHGGYVRCAVEDPKRYFTGMPERLYIPVPRLQQEKRGHCAGDLLFHTDHIQVPLEVGIPLREGSELRDRRYTLHEFIAYHPGPTIALGQYAYYRKVEGAWREIIDDHLKLCAEERIARILNDRSVLHVYYAPAPTE